MKVYVGNLPYDVTEEELRQEFISFGQVTSINIVKDRVSGRPKGFGFVEMASKSESDAAIAGLNGKKLKERTIVVAEARPETRSSGSYGDRRGGGGGFGGRGRQRRY
jgi:RNA recognition motif-containing protein